MQDACQTLDRSHCPGKAHMPQRAQAPRDEHMPPHPMLPPPNILAATHGHIPKSGMDVRHVLNH